MNNKKYYIAQSSIDGFGIFAKRAIKKGEVALILKGNVCHECTNVDHKKYFCKKCADWVGVDKNTWIDPIVPIKYINHSCNPNVGIKGRVTFRAIRNIKKDEELCFDYSTTEEDGVEWSIHCKCNYKHCRKKIGGIIDLPRFVFKKYLPYKP